MPKIHVVGNPPPVIDASAPLDHQWGQLEALCQAKTLEAHIIEITPDLADKILTEMNTLNRKRRRAKIKLFAADLDAGKWLLTGDTIKFGKGGGRLIDGQNRLTACVLSGKTMVTLAVFGVEEDAFLYTDTGSGRSNPDTLECMTVANSKIAAQAVRWIMIGLNEQGDRGASFTNPQIADYYNKKIDADRLNWAIAVAAKAGRTLPPGALAAHLYWLDEINPQATKAFVNDIGKRQHKGVGALISFIAEEKAAHQGRLHEHYTNALIVLTWLGYRDKKLVTKARLKKYSVNSEPYPNVLPVAVKPSKE
jgi:hypothetical protein